MRNFLIILLVVPFLFACNIPTHVSKCEGITCGLEIQPIYNASCECTEEHLGYRFTPSVNGKRSLFYFWKPPAYCYGSELPQPIHDIELPNLCTSGEYFNTTTKTCESCPAGTFAFYDGKITTWNHFPPQMSTECTRTYSWFEGPCNPWRLRGDHVDSGNNQDIDAINSDLNWLVETFEDASITFSYVVASEEYYDGFEFYIDGHLVYGRVSNQHEWKQVSFNITPGFHVLTWRYMKDFSFGGGEDRAKVKDIILRSTSNVILKCAPCPPGTFSQGKAAECSLCPENTYQDESGQDYCKPCPPLQKSYPGAVKCFNANLACNTSDYYAYYTPCNSENKRQKIYDWIKPTLCNTTFEGSVQLPPPETENCPVPACQPGQYINNNECEYCPEGSISDGITCVPCPAGHRSTHRVVYYNKFLPESMNNKFKSGCTGYCSSGWRAAGDVMDSGVGNGVSNSYVEFDPEVSIGSNVTIKYKLSCPVGSAALDIFVGNNLEKTIECSGCQAEPDEIRLVFSFSRRIGSHVVRVSYRKLTSTPSSYDCDIATISEIIVEGAPPQGGFTQCAACPAGTFSESGSLECTRCPAGTYAKAQAEKCDNCLENTFSYEGASQCFPCGSGMKSEEGSGSCEWEEGVCSFKTNVGGTPHIYDWLLLSDSLKNTPIRLQNSPETFYLNLDGNSTASPCGDSFACRITTNNTVVSLGNTISIAKAEATDSLLLTLVDYTRSCIQGKDGYMTSYVTLACSKSEYPPVVTRQNLCIHNFEVISPLACPICKEEDWVSQAGDCENYSKKITWTTKIACTRGVQKNSTTIACTPEVTFPFWTIPVAISVALVVILSIIAVVVFYGVKHYNLRRQYNRLIEDQDMGNEKL